MSYTRAFVMTATWWAQVGKDQYGKPTFGTPTKVICRWEDRTDTIIDKKGQERVIKSRVFLEGNTPVTEEGYLFLGDSNAASPLGLAKAYEVQGIKRTPDLRNLKQLVVAFL